MFSLLAKQIFLLRTVDTKEPQGQETIRQILRSRCLEAEGVAVATTNLVPVINNNNAIIVEKPAPTTKVYIRARHLYSVVVKTFASGAEVPLVARV